MNLLKQFKVHTSWGHFFPAHILNIYVIEYDKKFLVSGNTETLFETAYWSLSYCYNYYNLIDKWDQEL